MYKPVHTALLAFMAVLLITGCISIRGPHARISVGQDVAYERGGGKVYDEAGQLKSEYVYEFVEQNESKAARDAITGATVYGLGWLSAGVEKAKTAADVSKVKDAGKTARAADGNATSVLLKKEDTTQALNALELAPEIP